MNLNPVMLEEAKDVIYNECGLPESNKEPVHLAIKNLFMLEFAYKDFLSREMAGEVARVEPILDIIRRCDGNAAPFLEWFMGYEKPEGSKAVASPWFG